MAFLDARKDEKKPVVLFWTALISHYRKHNDYFESERRSISHKKVRRKDNTTNFQSKPTKISALTDQTLPVSI